MASKPRLLIVGGGLSGLCLAQALIQKGFDVAVFERDAGPDVRGQGYRLTIDAIGSHALHACVPTKQYEFIRSSSGKTQRIGAFIFLDERARELHRSQFEVETNEQRGLIAGQVDRETLRRGLLSGIAQHVHFGKVFSRYEERGEQILALFDDGSSAEGDALVGADGVNSVVRQQRYPTLNPHYIGSSAIFGRTQVGNAKLPVLQRFLDAGGITALGPHGRAVFCTTMRFREDPATVAARLGLDVGQISAKDYMMWAVVFRADQFDDPLSAAPDPAALRQIAFREVDGFNQDFRTLVEHAEPNDAVLVPIRAMPRLKEQRASRVTLIGDAIHIMPPFGARGANTSLKDSQVLATVLSASATSSMRTSIAAYESDMRAYSYKAARSARQMMRLATADFPFKKAFLVTLLRIAGAFAK
ncbi:MAG TPA: NAD(P)/FAD-dependent oxidoreductase [Steroidobacteraceae bacterium]|jgi:2-polyprenyl-6-methoxyphenol hydroxylase-like FAD-dependent oxidoreductase|nr:NAD(P)/FAD-dependent oxidoreductase [Steroidobacteraceae bacterium]